MGSKKKKTRMIEKLTATNRDLKRTLSSVRGQLTKTETRLAKANETAERWKKEAGAHRAAASRFGTQVEKLQKKLDRATAAVKPVPATVPNAAARTDPSGTEPTAADAHSVP